jgi:hypothetical protein
VLAEVRISSFSTKNMYPEELKIILFKERRISVYWKQVRKYGFVHMASISSSIANFLLMLYILLTSQKNQVNTLIQEFFILKNFPMARILNALLIKQSQTEQNILNKCYDLIKESTKCWKVW